MDGWKDAGLEIQPLPRILRNLRNFTCDVHCALRAAGTSDLSDGQSDPNAAPYFKLKICSSSSLNHHGR